MIESETTEWAKWVIFFAMGGFFGNFALTLCDHAQNGFFISSEWIPVVSSALAVGFLSVLLIQRVSQKFFNICFCIIGLQIVVGLIGFGFHLRVNLAGGSAELIENFIYGAPIFAPLLFPNLSLLATIGIWDLKSKL